MRVLLLLCLVWGQAWAATYYADPAGSGVACTIGAPCTLAQCTTTASTADTCSLNAGTYDQTTSGINFSTKNLTYTSTGAACSAIITSTNATRTVALNASNNATPLIFSNISVIGDSAQNPIQIGDQNGFDHEVQITGNCITGGTVKHIGDNDTRGTQKITNNILTGTLGTSGGIISSVTPSASGKKLVITGNTISVTSANNSQVSAILVQRATTSTNDFFTYVADNTVTATESAAGSNAAIVGISVSRITNAPNLSAVSTAPVIENNTVSVSSTGTVNDTDAIMVWSDAVTIGNNPIVRNNMLTCNAPVSRCLSIGTDGATAQTVTDSLVSGNTVTGTYYNGSATPHGISVGNVTRGVIRSNFVTGHAAGILAGTNQGALFSGNIVRGATYVGLFAKGSGATTSPTFTNNNVVMDDRILGARHGGYGCIGAAIQGATNNTATTFANNSCRVANGTGWKYVVVDSSQFATFSNNNYVSDVTLSSPWTYQGAAQTTLSGWQGAQEASALGGASGYVGGNSPTTSAGFRLSADSALRRAGKDLNIGNVQDCENQAFSHPPDIGACGTNSGDAAAARTAR